MNDEFEVIDIERGTIEHSGFGGDEKSPGMPVRMTVRCVSCDDEFIATYSRAMTPGTFTKVGGGYLVSCRKGKHRGVVAA